MTGHMAAALNPGITPIWTVTVAQYHAMIDRGILTSDDAVELLEGIIVQKVSKNPPHRIATFITREALRRLVPLGWYVDEQEPITLDKSEPEPDVAVIRGDTRDYMMRHPGPSDIALVVEIAEATLDRDRILKRRIYATAEIPFYWVMDLNSRRLEVFSDPKDGTYRLHAVCQEHERVSVVLDGTSVGSILVSDLLP